MTTTPNTMSMESQLNCSLDDLVKMQRQAAAKGRNSQRKNQFRRGNGPKVSGRGRAINKRVGGSTTGGAASGRAGGPVLGNVGGATRRGRGGRGGFNRLSRNLPTPNPGVTKKKNFEAAPKVSLAQRLAQPLESSVRNRKSGKPGTKKAEQANSRRAANAPVSAQRKIVRPGMRHRGGLASRNSRLPLGLPRTRDGVIKGRPAARLVGRSTAAARLQGRGAGSAPRGRKAVTVRKAGGISKLAKTARRTNTAAARLKAARPGASRPLNTSFNRRAQGTPTVGGFASAVSRPSRTAAAAAGASRRRAQVAQKRVPVLRGGSAQQSVQRTVPSASDLELMSKIKIMATLDKVPPPMAAQRGMAVTPPQAMVDEHGYANNGNKPAQAAHLPYNGYGGGSLSDRFSKYGPR